MPKFNVLKGLYEPNGEGYKQSAEKNFGTGNLDQLIEEINTLIQKQKNKYLEIKEELNEKLIEAIQVIKNNGVNVINKYVAVVGNLTDLIPQIKNPNKKIFAQDIRQIVNKVELNEAITNQSSNLSAYKDALKMADEISLEYITITNELTTKQTQLKELQKTYLDECCLSAIQQVKQKAVHGNGIGSLCDTLKGALERNEKVDFKQSLSTIGTLKKPTSDQLEQVENLRKIIEFHSKNVELINKAEEVDWSVETETSSSSNNNSQKSLTATSSKINNSANHNSAQQNALNNKQPNRIWEWVKANPIKTTLLLGCAALSAGFIAACIIFPPLFAITLGIALPNLVLTSASEALLIIGGFLAGGGIGILAAAGIAAVEYFKSSDIELTAIHNNSDNIPKDQGKGDLTSNTTYSLISDATSQKNISVPDSQKAGSNNAKTDEKSKVRCCGWLFGFSRKNSANKISMDGNNQNNGSSPNTLSQ